MSEKKCKGESKVWGLVPDDLLKKALMRVANRNSGTYIRLDGSTNRMRVLHDIVIVGARKLFTDWNDTEGLQVLTEHEQRLAAKLALQTHQPLPNITPTQPPAPASTPQTSTPTPTESAPASATQATPTVPTPTVAPTLATVKKPRKIVSLIINESGHSRVKRE